MAHTAEEALKMIDRVIDPDIYDMIPKEIIEARARRYSRIEDKKDAIRAERQAKIMFAKTMHLKSLSAKFQDDGSVPLPMPKKVVKHVYDMYCTKSPYAFVTVNPYPKTPLPVFEKAVNKLLSKKTIPCYFQVYEVRRAVDDSDDSDDSKGPGLHAHILLEYTGTPSNFKRSTKNTFKTVCDISNNCILNIKFVKPEVLQSKIDYMLGQKQDKKQSGVQATIQYRKANNLPDWTESCPPFPCRAAQKLIN